ncbi:secoisolariciresinol dehydrogenase-like [Aristolochia californica]|uniref:secoisolariciresinol dehydrogenase-like n=1 Tax=Aristolochia californica TaxID=171875 RepID=UPI0035E017BF
MAGSFIVSSLARRMEGKVALITGGASGIGECTARFFCRNGGKVVIADVQDELGHSVCRDLGHDQASYVHCDVTDESHVRGAVDAAVAQHGKLDIMFNNAGIIDDPKASIVDNEKADFDRVMAVNLTGVFLGTKHAARVMIPKRAGCIVSTASISSVVGASASHAYTCAKHAVAGLTKNAAVELGQFGIRVNCVSPYALATPLSERFVKLQGEEFEKAMSHFGNLKGVYLKAEDVAEAVTYLASDESKFVSGHNLVIDGGFSVHNPSFGMFKYPNDAN